MQEVRRQDFDGTSRQVVSEVSRNEDLEMVTNRGSQDGTCTRSTGSAFKIATFAGNDAAEVSRQGGIGIDAADSGQAGG